MSNNTTLLNRKKRVEVLHIAANTVFPFAEKHSEGLGEAEGRARESIWEPRDAALVMAFDAQFFRNLAING